MCQNIVQLKVLITTFTKSEAKLIVAVKCCLPTNQLRPSNANKFKMEIVPEQANHVDHFAVPQHFEMLTLKHLSTQVFPQHPDLSVVR